MFDLDAPFPRECLTYPETHVRGRKRRLNIVAEDSGTEATDEETKVVCCKLCLRYNSMLYLGYVESDEMLVVEQPWLSVVATFPEALQRRVYGS